MMKLEKVDVPQANKLEVVRLLVEAVHDGQTRTDQLHERTGLSPRHVSYYFHAARILGFLDGQDGEPHITTVGKALLATQVDSDEETAELAKAVLRSESIRKLSGDLLGDVSKEQLTERIVSLTGLAQSTAARRADALMAWRARLVGRSTSKEPTAIRLDRSEVEVANLLPPAAREKGKRSDPPLTAVEVPPPALDASSDTPEADGDNILPQGLLPPNVLANLATQLQRGRLCLFTGAGFSYDATDRNGRKLPLGEEFAREIWPIVFGNDPFEPGSNLRELFAAAAASDKKALESLLKSRFDVDDSSLASHYETWWSSPWRRVYTLNVDNLELAAARRFQLPFHPRSVHALPGAHVDLTRRVDELPVYHLNGTAKNGVDGVTFDIHQYARRAGDQDPVYQMLAADMLAFPFVLVGTALDEPLLWQHVELRRVRAARSRELRPRSFLISPTLSRARRRLLEEYNVIWIEATAERFANEVLSKLTAESKEGAEQVRTHFRMLTDSAENILDVTELLVAAKAEHSDFLLGAQPDWTDLVSGRIAERRIDGELLEQAKKLLDLGHSPASVLIVTGTAGAGKSACLLRLAAGLSAAGRKVSWVGPDVEASPRTVSRLCENEDGPDVVVVDDADRYGEQSVAVLRQLAKGISAKLVVAGVRSSRADRLLRADVQGEHPPFEVTIPLLEDDDINAVLAVLRNNKRLGVLAGRTNEQQVSAFREKAGRQLLVAMIEATSGTRFDEKVVTEWEDLTPDGRFVYAVVALTSSLRYYPTKMELLVATQDAVEPGVLSTIEDLASRKVITTKKDRYLARHRVIAEKLVEALGARGEQLRKVLANAAYAVSAGVTHETLTSSWQRRFLRRMLNHEYLYHLAGVEGAQGVYRAVEDTLHWDHHFWLQRGSLEVKYGQLGYAQLFLDTAKSHNASDALVTTEYAYMLFKKAIESPESPDAQSWETEARTMLRTQVAQRGTIDAHPYHVLGSQGLVWSGKARMSLDERREYLDLLLALVREGAAKHPGAQELRDLREKIQRARLSLEVVRSGPGD